VIEFKVVVEPDLPQDKLQQSQVAQNITAGADPLVPKRWARENVLNEGQSDDIQREIWTEQMSTAAFQAGIQETLLIGQQAAKALTDMLVGQAQQGAGQAQPPEGMQVPPNMPPAPQQSAGGQMGMPGQPMPPTQPLPPAPGEPNQGIPEGMV
jgi:hypothetical protein